MINRLVFIVEGDTEVRFIDNQVMPYLYGKLPEGTEISIEAITITTNRKQNKKGGIGSYALLKNNVERVFAQGNVIVTTLLDFFRLPTSFPNHSTDPNRIGEIEEGISEDFDNREDLIPYIQKHEMEALMFANLKGFDLVIDDEIEFEQIEKIANDYPNPEDINNGPDTAPSKRLENIFGYEKGEDNDADLIIQMMDINDILDKCPRFSAWINKLEATLLSRI